jgi:hypothetical protein
MNQPRLCKFWQAEDVEGQDAGMQSEKLPWNHQTAHPTPKAENQRAPCQTQTRANQKAREPTQKKNLAAREKHQKKLQPQKKQLQHQRNWQNQKEQQLSAHLPYRHGP